MSCRPANPAQRRYIRRVFGFMTFYVAALFFAKWMFKRGLAEGAIAWGLALLPALPIIAVFWAIGRLLVEESDEYLRVQLVRQSLVATAFAMAVATVWGFLEAFGLVGHVDAYFAAILWFAGLGLGGLVNWLSRPRLED
jgi:hypothetical protein